MAISIDNVLGLIQGIKYRDPRAYEALKAIVQLLDDLIEDQRELERQVNGSSSAIASPSDLNYELKYRAIRFEWTAISNAAQYELRLGTDWDTADFVTRVTNNNIEIEPKVSGSYTYLLKSIRTDGTYSDTPAQVVVVIPSIAALNLSVQVIDNNIILDWDEPDHPFEIEYYEIFKDGVSLGYVDASFFTRFEAASGDYTYKVIAVDIAGNESANAELVATVNQPPDYVLEENHTSDFSGTKTNCYLDGSRLIAIFDTTETWASHFTGNSWTDIEDQITAGFPYFAQDGPTTGQYEEEYDFGVLLENSIITINWSANPISDTVTVSCSIDTSEDGVVWAGYTSGTSLFAASFRYIRVKLEFSGSGNNDLIEITNLTFSVSVKQEVDSGLGDAGSGDAAPGTAFTFNKDFKDVNSIVVSPVSANVPYNIVVSFTDIPNPTTFYVMVFDTTGKRVTLPIKWVARGVV